MAVPARKIADGVASLAQRLGHFIDHILQDENNFSALADGLKSVDTKAWTPVLKSRVDRAVRIQVRRVCRPYVSFEVARLTLSTLRTCERYVLEVDEQASLRMAAYADLVEDTLAERRDFSAGRVLKMKHVREILQLVRHSSPLNRAELQRRFDLGEANLTRVLNAMEAAGLIERVTTGRTVEIRLPQAEKLSLPAPAGSLPSPSVVSGASRKWVIYVERDGSAFSQAVTYAREIGADRDVGIEIKEVDDISGYGNDLDSRIGVVKAHTTRPAEGWKPHYVFGTNLGGEFIAVGPEFSSVHADRHASSLERVTALTEFVTGKSEFEICLGESDPHAKEFAQRILVALRHSPKTTVRWGKGNCDTDGTAPHPHENALIAYWAAPRFTSKFASQKRASVRWLDFEAAADEQVWDTAQKISRASAIRKALNSVVQHWVLSTRVVSPDLQTTVPFQELLARIYWLGASTAGTIRNDRASYLAYAKAKLKAAGVDAEMAASVDDDRVRMPVSSDYLTNASADRYYWEALGPHRDECMNLHLRETGHLRDDYLIHLHGLRINIAKKSPKKPPSARSKGS